MLEKIPGLFLLSFPIINNKVFIPPLYLHSVGVVIALPTVRISKVTFELCPQLFFEFFLNQIKLLISKLLMGL